MNICSDVLDLNSKMPALSIVIESKNKTEMLDKYLMSLALTNNRSFDADQVALELDDAG